MPGEGVEPTRISPEDFKSSASAYSATPACENIPKNIYGGDERIRTADRGFADLGLATWRRRHILYGSVHSILRMAVLVKVHTLERGEMRRE